MEGSITHPQLDTATVSLETAADKHNLPNTPTLGVSQGHAELCLAHTQEGCRSAVNFVARGLAGPLQATTRDPSRKKSASQMFATAEHIGCYTIHAYKLWAPRNGVKRSFLCERRCESCQDFDSGRIGPIIFSPCFGCQPASFCWHSSRWHSQAHQQKGLGILISRRATLGVQDEGPLK